MRFGLRSKALCVLLLCGLLFGGPVRPAGAEEIEITARSAVLLDPVSGAVLFEKDARLRVEPASVTKIMTLVLALEAIDAGKIALEDEVIASENAYRMGGSQLYLKPGETLTVREMLLAIALHSANDACVAMGEHIAGTHEAFVRMMNEKAVSLGMRDTHFMNAHGIDAAEHYMSAYDVALLSRYAVNNTDILNYTSVWEHWLRDGKTWLVNRNSMLKRYPGMDGLKTGYTTTAKNCLSATAVRDGLRLIAVVMGAPSSDIRFKEIRSLLDYGFASYKGLPVIRQGDIVQTVDVMKGKADKLALAAGSGCTLTVRKGEEPRIEQVVHLDRTPVAPIKIGERIGEMIISLDGQEAARVELLAAESVGRGNIFLSIYRFAKEMISPVRSPVVLP